MAEYVVALRGWHPALARAELAALCQDSEQITNRLCRVSCDSPESVLQVAAGVQGFLANGVVSDLEGLLPAVREYLQSNPRDGSLAVTAWRHNGKKKGLSPTNLSMQIGAIMHENGSPIDLGNPDHRLGLVLDSSGVIAFGWLTGEGPAMDGSSARAPTNRPYFKPVSLEPRLARLAVNLACGLEGIVVDPMTGTGGFILEAADTGREGYGVDLDSKMVYGAQKNLQWINENSNCQIIHGDAVRLAKVLPENIHNKVAGIVLDPPYGRNSQGNFEHTTLLDKTLSSAKTIVSNQAGLVIILPTKFYPENLEQQASDDVEMLHGDLATLEQLFSKHGLEIQGKWSIPVHASLSRLLIHARFSPLN